MNGFVRHCRVHWPLWTGLVVAGCGLFPRLGTGALWEDEAETAALARNTARWGYPRVWDGRNVVTQEYGRDANAEGVWVLSPWLPVYLVAASFRLFGVSALTARLPFAVIAWLTVAAVYGAGRRSPLGDAATAWATLLLATSVPFLLFGRQCRGYTLSALLLLVLIYLLAELDRRKRATQWRTIVALGLVGGLQFHSNYLVLLLALPGIVIVVLVMLRRTGASPQLLISGLLAAALSLPWALYAELPQRLGGSAPQPGPAPEAALSSIVESSPVWAPLVLLVVVTWVAGGGARSVWRTSRLTAVGGSVIVPYLAFDVLLSARGSPVFFRYFVPLLPIACLLAGSCLAALGARSRVVALAIGGIVATTNLGWEWARPLLCVSDHPAARCYLVDMGYELTHPYQGPVDGLVLYLASHARPGDTLFVSYEAEPLLFHTSLRIVREIPFREPPRWIVLRVGHGGNFDNVLTKGFDQTAPERGLSWQRPQDRQVEARNLLYVQGYTEQHGYRAHELPATDLAWQNRPDILLHRFRGSTAPPCVTLWEHP